jgi:hypothetical protein
MTRQQWDTTKRGTWFALGVLSTAFALWWTMTPPSVTPEDHRYGLVSNHAEIAAPVVAASTPFQVVNANGVPVYQDNSRAVVKLWDATVKVLGRHTDNYPQQVGDCVSFGAKNALEYLICVRLASGKHDNNSEYAVVSTAYIYGISRVQIGQKRVRGDGSVGAWAAQGVTKFGVLPLNAPGCPPYSGAVARQWGVSGPPDDLIRIAMATLVKTTAPVATAVDCRDAICNGYPVTIASDFGSTDIKPRDGQQVARRNTRWMHQMCVVGYDGSRGPAGRFYILNSWGAAAHPAPLADEPPGGFWVEAADMDYITRQGDSWAYSDFDGFPAQQLTIDVFASTVPFTR